VIIETKFDRVADRVFKARREGMGRLLLVTRGEFRLTSVHLTNHMRIREYRVG
jgi:hypothetical protein